MDARLLPLIVVYFSTGMRASSGAAKLTPPETPRTAVSNRPPRSLG
jgi:hypothetical protein